jgi:transposase-like protein
VGEVVLSLHAKGWTTDGISAPFADVYGASVSKEMISWITGKVIEEMTDRPHRPFDAIVIKVRGGQVADRPFLRRDRAGATVARDAVLMVIEGSGG